MKLFGTVKSFDSAQGHGQITPEAGGDVIRFDKSAIAWDKKKDPTSASASPMKRARPMISPAR